MQKTHRCLVAVAAERRFFLLVVRHYKRSGLSDKLNVQAEIRYFRFVCGRLPVKQALPSIVQNKTRKYVRFLNGDAISEPTMYTHLGSS
jgi:hypothetical protein